MPNLLSLWHQKVSEIIGEISHIIDDSIDCHNPLMPIWRLVLCLRKEISVTKMSTAKQPRVIQLIVVMELALTSNMVLLTTHRSSWWCTYMLSIKDDIVRAPLLAVSPNGSTWKVSTWQPSGKSYWSATSTDSHWPNIKCPVNDIVENECRFTSFEEERTSRLLRKLRSGRNKKHSYKRRETLSTNPDIFKKARLPGIEAVRENICQQEYYSSAQTIKLSIYNKILAIFELICRYCIGIPRYVAQKDQPILVKQLNLLQNAHWHAEQFATYTEIHLTTSFFSGM